MDIRWILQVGSTFVCNNLADRLCRGLATAGVTASVRLTDPAGLTQHMLAPAADSEEVAGTIILVRVEDWLRDTPDQTDDKSARKELKTHLDEFVNQVSVLAMRGRPVWLVVCPSVGWVAETCRLTALCRTYTNLLAARLRNSGQITLLAWPESLSKEEFCDRELDGANHVPFTAEAFDELAESLVHQLTRILSANDSNTVASVGTLGSPELANFLSGLHVQVSLAPAKPAETADVGRILRTAASFSMTGEKPTLSNSEADAIVASQDCWLIRVSDRLSDYGASGVTVARAEDDVLVIEALSLSCTVLGKQVEYALLGALKEIATTRNFPTIAFEYRDSGRNQPALAFLKSVASENSSRRYVVRVGEVDERVKKVTVAPGAWTVSAEM